MSDIILIDARGMLCPKPLITLKSRLDTLQCGQIFEVWLDNLTACSNVRRFLETRGYLVQERVDDEVYVVSSVQREVLPESPSVALEDIGEQMNLSCEDMQIRAGYVIVFAQDKMGLGEDDLGALLIQGAVNALREVKPYPSTIIFYNSGVKLLCEGSPAVEGLIELEKKGIRLLVCGTCLDYYELRDKMGVGQVSNMYEILECVGNASHVFRP